MVLIIAHTTRYDATPKIRKIVFKNLPLDARYLATILFVHRSYMDYELY